MCRTIDAERRYHESRSTNRRISFDQYLRHDEINSYLDQLALDYPALVTVSTIGQSYENRTMKIIRISTGTTPKPVFFVEAGMHAREWISPALSLYIINQLVENPDNRGLLEDLDWVVLPSLNPDGYEFTWTSVLLHHYTLWRLTMVLAEPDVEEDALSRCHVQWY